jgi:hypothetical protein
LHSIHDLSRRPQFHSEALAPLQPTLDILPTFASNLRRSLAVAAIRPTFRLVPRAVLLSWLGMTEEDDAEELESLVKELGWTADANGEVIAIPENEENAPKGSIAREPLTMDSAFESPLNCPSESRGLIDAQN